MAVKPITPTKAGVEKVRSIPDKVVEVFNQLIVENLSQGSATVSQSDAVARIKAAFPNEGTESIFKKGWLDVEPLFRRAGWDVKYDKPAYNEDYAPSFTFTVKS